MIQTQGCCGFESHLSYLNQFYYVLAEQPGVLAILSGWRSWDQILSGTLLRRGTQAEIHRRHSSRLAPPVPNRIWDVWLEEHLSPEAETVAYSGKFVAMSKQPLTPLQTRALYRRLRNLSSRQRT